MNKVMSVLFVFMLIFTACGEKIPVEVQADYLPSDITVETADIPVMEVVSLSDEYDLFIRDNSEHSTYVVFSANTSVKDFALYTIAVPVAEEIQYDCEKPVLYYDDLSVEKSLIIKMAMPETVPWYGISYKDENGDTIKYAVFLSGYDGSIILEKFE